MKSFLFVGLCLLYSECREQISEIVEPLQKPEMLMQAYRSISQKSGDCRSSVSIFHSRYKHSDHFVSRPRA